MYAISAAYISAGGGLVSGVSPLAEAGGSVLYALAVAAVVLLGAVSVDRLTRVLFAVMVLVFALLMALLLPQMAPDRLSTGPVTPGLYFSALPVLFTAFGFHAVMPSVTEYLEGDQAGLRRAVLLGTGIPLVVYLLWQFAIFGLIPQAELMQVRDLDALSQVMTQATGNQNLGLAVQVFSALALTTSVLGVGLALLHSLRDVLGGWLGKARWLWLGLLTFVPPTLLATLYPQGFVALLGYAGILAVLYTVLLPGLLLLRVRRQHPTSAPRLGGQPAIWLSLGLGAAIILIPLLVQAGWLPAVAS